MARDGVADPGRRRRPRRRAAIGRVAAVALLALGVAACGPTAPSGPPPPCSVAEHHEIPAPVEPTGTLPPTMPPGIAGEDLWPLAEAVSDNGRWHLWAVAQGDDTLAGPLVEHVLIYAADVVAGDAPTRVGTAGTWPGLYPTNLYFRNGVGYPEHVAFVGIDPEGAGFALAVDYHEIDYTFFYPSHPDPTEARVLIYEC